MATYQFSALSDGQAISFNPTADILNFDQSAVAAADIRVTASGTSTRIDVIAGPQAGKDITLLNTGPFQLAISNVTFADGSRLLFGDNSTATGDDNGNTLAGGTGRDLIFAFGGSDTINVGTANYGNDFVDGGSGYDTLNFNGYVTTGLVVDFATGTATGSGGTVTFVNIERFAGGSGNDIINGNAAAQNIGAVAGNDTIWGAGGNDTLFSGLGTDTFVFRETGTANADLMGDFASGTDKILLDAKVMTALGASGNFAAGDARFWAAAGATGGHDADDRIIYNTTTRQLFYDADGSGSGAAQLVATLQSGGTLAAADIVVEGGTPPSGQTINGTPGPDWLHGGLGNDTVNGLGGDDNIFGHEGNDVLDGGDGRDSFSNDPGDDTLLGGSGNDVFHMDGQPGVQLGHDLIDGGSGRDALLLPGSPNGMVFNAATGTVTGLAPGDSLTFTNIEDFYGTQSADQMTGDANANLFSGQGGSDTIDGGAGDDTLYGWSGPLYELFEEDDGGDVLFGGAGNDTIEGSEGADSLVGGDGIDVLNGGMDGDALTGGGGSDSFVFAVAPGSANADQITDFASGADKIRLDGSVMSGAGISGNFSTGDARFHAAAGATGGHDADDRVVYNTTTRQLFYDADGSGADAAQLIATLQAGAMLVATDIAVDNGTTGTTPFSNGVVNTIGHSSDNDVNTLLNPSLYKWGTGDAGTGVSLTYSFRTDASVYAYSFEPNQPGWVPWTEANKQAIRDALDAWSEIANLEFTEVVDSAQVAGDLRFGTTVNLNNAAAWGYYPAPSASAGDVWVGNNAKGTMDALGANPGTSSFHLILHEIGHALGLKHPFETPNVLDASKDHWGYTVMSYTLAAPDQPDDVPPYPVEPMLLDTAAIQYLYGANMSTATGDDTYAWAVNEAIYETLWDAAGNDTIDWGNQSTAALINLNGGTWSEIGTQRGGSALGATRTLAIAQAAVIENAKGGAAGDFIYGNAVANRLEGGGGGDNLDGGTGNDTLFGGAGGDSFVLAAAPGAANADVIGDFATGVDKIMVDNTIMTGLGATGNLSAGDGRFHSAAGASAAHDADDRLVYNTTTGQLFYDADGSGAGAAQLVATLSGAPTLAATDIVVVSGKVNGVVLDGTAGNDSLMSGVGNDTLSGSAGNDTLDGWTHDDVLRGGDGNDRLVGGRGADTLDGGAGNDTLLGGEGFDDFLLTAAPGAANADVVADFFSSRDQIMLDRGVMSALGASGTLSEFDVRFYQNTGATAGHDADDRVIYNTSTGQLFYDADGNGAGASLLLATLSQGTLLFAEDIVVIDALFPPPPPPPPPPNGEINGTAGNDSLTGTAGNDTINGLAGNDTLRGLDGDDTLDGGDGIDSLDGGLGNDTYVVTAGDVLVADPGGVDTVRTAVSWNISSGTVDNITMTGTSNVSVEGNNLTNVIVGNDAPNYINARGGSDTISGNGGNDTFNMSKGGTTSFGNDSIDGGTGVDTVEFGVNATSGLAADLAAGTVTGGEANGAGSSTIRNIERFIAGDFNDIVSGSGVANYVDARAGNDTVSGGAGADTLIGGTGNDRLAGGTGIDSMTGGAGLDSFVFGEAPGSANADRITDFVSASDKVLLDDAFHSSIGALGNFAAGDARFWAAAGATSGHDANDRVIYNTSTGSLYYDADGSGAGAAQLIATFTGNPAIAATDISVI